MGDNTNNQATTLNDPTAGAPDAAAYEKGKGKAVDAPDLSMDEDEDSSSEDEDIDEVEEEDDDQSGLEPIDPANIIAGRTRRKNIDFDAEPAGKTTIGGDDLMDDEDDDDENYRPDAEGDDLMQE